MHTYNKEKDGLHLPREITRSYNWGQKGMNQDDPQILSWLYIDDVVFKSSKVNSHSYQHWKTLVTNSPPGRQVTRWESKCFSRRHTGSLGLSDTHLPGTTPQAPSSPRLSPPQAFSLPLPRRTRLTLPYSEVRFPFIPPLHMALQVPLIPELHTTLKIST